MNLVQLPLTTDCPQSFKTQLGNTTYQFNLIWNDRSSVWMMDIINPITQAPIVSGIALVLGADLLEPYALEIGALVLVDETGTGSEATLTSLGASVSLYWVSPDELPVGYPGSTQTA
jgi:uncharacterized protein DUF6983